MAKKKITNSTDSIQVSSVAKRNGQPVFTKTVRANKDYNVGDTLYTSRDPKTGKERIAPKKDVGVAKVVVDRVYKKKK